MFLSGVFKAYTIPKLGESFIIQTIAGHECPNCIWWAHHKWKAYLDFGCCIEKFWSLHPWRHSRPISAMSCAGCCSWSCFEHWVRLDDLQRSLLTPATPCQRHCLSSVVSSVGGGGWDNRDSKLKQQEEISDSTGFSLRLSLWLCNSFSPEPSGVGSVETCGCGWGLWLIPTVYPSYFTQCEQLCPVTRNDRTEVNRRGKIKSTTVVNWFVFYPPSPRIRGAK